MPLDTCITFVAATTVLLLIPGPTILLVLSYAISQGRRVAVSTAAGVAVGDLVAMTASLAGLGAVVLASATLFAALKWAGAVYLVYLGVKMIVSARRVNFALPQTDAISTRRTFTHAAAVTALNPKSIAFFIAFVPQFIQPGAPLMPQFAILVGTFVTMAALNALAYALLAGSLRDRLARPGVIAWLTRAGGATLIGMGVLTATLRRS
ncbi:LysE family translocator [Gymnodinialimonas sp. 57CJ19]|uniref:LysE family translocator n=1 Tax=Gymnodinialimonas sp. 57CJ19 TaxID=3138498 RepID=UPI003134507E